MFGSISPLKANILQLFRKNFCLKQQYSNCLQSLVLVSFKTILGNYYTCYSLAKIPWRLLKNINIFGWPDWVWILLRAKYSNGFQNKIFANCYVISNYMFQVLHEFIVVFSIFQTVVLLGLFDRRISIWSTQPPVLSLSPLN